MTFAEYVVDLQRRWRVCAAGLLGRLAGGGSGATAESGTALTRRYRRHLKY